MSLNPLLIACESLQADVRSVWAESDPLAVKDPVPFYEFLLSPENTAGIVQAIAPGKGKVRNMNVTWEQRISESAVTSVTGRDCEATGENQMFEANYAIDTEAVEKVSMKIDVADLAHLCENDEMYIARQMVKLFDAMDRKVASNVAAQALPLVGTYSQDAIAAYSIGSPYNTLTVTTKTSGNLVPGAWEEIDSARIMSGFSSFIGFGGQGLNEYMRNSLAGCCTNYGLDIAELYSLYGQAYAYDRRLAAALAASSSKEALFTEIGALQLLRYTRNAALTENRILDFNFGFEAFTDVTPRGLPVDVLIKVDCPGEIHITVFSNTKLVGMPDDLYASGDNFVGTKGTGFVKLSNT